MTQSTPEDESQKLVYAVAQYCTYYSWMYLIIPVVSAQIYKTANKKYLGSQKLKS